MYLIDRKVLQSFNNPDLEKNCNIYVNKKSNINDTGISIFSTKP